MIIARPAVVFPRISPAPVSRNTAASASAAPLVSRFTSTATGTVTAFVLPFDSNDAMAPIQKPASLGQKQIRRSCRRRVIFPVCVTQIQHHALQFVAGCELLIRAGQLVCKVIRHLRHTHIGHAIVEH